MQAAAASLGRVDPGNPAAAESWPTGDGVPRPPLPRTQASIIAGWQGDADLPLVSVVCHTYNHEHFIRDALNGFLMQETRFPFEIVINDDASTDGTAQIIKDYIKEYPRLIRATLQQENQFSQGISPRNFSFPRVRGTYIAICEGDDYWISPTKLQEQVDAFMPGISLVFHDALSIAAGTIRDHSYYRPGAVPVHGYTPWQMARGCKIPTASVLFLAAPFKKEKHENIINGDHLIWATLASLGAARFLPRPYSVYRYHDGGIWSTRSVVDKVEPSLRSKRVIFDGVDRRFKTSAAVGYAGVALTLAHQLLEQGEHTQATRLMRSLYGQVLTMLPHCRLQNLNNLKDVLLLVRILGIRVPKAWLRTKFGGSPR